MNESADEHLQLILSDVQMESKAILYYRVSTRQQGDSNLGIEAQQEACKNFAHANQIEVLEEIREVASGTEDERPKLMRAIELAKKHKAMIVVSRLCRLSRKVSFISRLMEKEVPFASVEFGTKVSPLMIHIYASVYEQHRKYISMRTKEALAQAKKRGVQLGCKDWDERLLDGRTTNRARADKFALQMFPLIDGLMKNGVITYAALADALNERGIKTRSKKKGGSKWYATTIKNLLARVALLQEQGLINENTI